MNIDNILKKHDLLLKVYFGLRSGRTPSIGKFVKHKDVDDLKKKNMVRFVHYSKFEEYDNGLPDDNLTVIFTAHSIEQIKVVNG